MKPVLKNESVRQWEAWFLLGILVALQELSAWGLAGGEMMVPGFFSRFSVLYSYTVADLIVLAYCIRRFGRIELVELFPRRGDWVVLGLAVLTVFWYFALTVGRAGMTTDTYDSIRDLPRYQYWLSIVHIAAIGPLLEEALFRRYLLEIFRRHYPAAIAVLIIAGVSILFHLGLPVRSLIFIFFAELLYGFVYVKSRLGVSVLVHAFLNGLVLLLSR